VIVAYFFKYVKCEVRNSGLGRVEMQLRVLFVRTIDLQWFYMCDILCTGWPKKNKPSRITIKSY